MELIETRGFVANHLNLLIQSPNSCWQSWQLSQVIWILFVTRNCNAWAL